MHNGLFAAPPRRSFCCVWAVLGYAGWLYCVANIFGTHADRHAVHPYSRAGTLKLGQGANWQGTYATV